MKLRTLPTLVSIVGFGAVTATFGTIELTDAASLNYSQDFDKVAFQADFTKAGTGNPLFWDGGADADSTDNTSWGNNATFNGWYRQVAAGGFTNRQDKDFLGEIKSGTPRFGLAGNGGTWGTPSDDPPVTLGDDTALGLLMEGTGNSGSFGAVFENNTGQTVTSMDIAYTGEQWFRGQAGTLQFQYKVLDSLDGFLINEGTGWLDANSLDFASIANGGNLKRNGNAGAFQTDLSDTITLSALDGEFIAMRWQYTSSSASAQAGLFVDDFTANFTVVPEPSAYALLAGTLALSGVMLRRRRQS